MDNSQATMDIEHYYNTVTNYLVNHPIIAGIIFVGLAIFFVKKTSTAIKTLAFVLFLIGGFYFVSQMGGASSHGVKSKNKGIHKSIEALDE